MIKIEGQPWDLVREREREREGGWGKARVAQLIFEMIELKISLFFQVRKFVPGRVGSVVGRVVFYGYKDQRELINFMKHESNQQVWHRLRSALSLNFEEQLQRST